MSLENTKENKGFNNFSKIFQDLINYCQNKMRKMGLYIFVKTIEGCFVCLLVCFFFVFGCVKNEFLNSSKPRLGVDGSYEPSI